MINHRCIFNQTRAYLEMRLKINPIRKKRLKDKKIMGLIYLVQKKKVKKKSFPMIKTHSKSSKFKFIKISMIILKMINYINMIARYHSKKSELFKIIIINCSIKLTKIIKLIILMMIKFKTTISRKI